MLLILELGLTFEVYSQEKITDTNTPLHLIQPEYPVPYGNIRQEETIAVLNKIYDYLNGVTPAELVEGDNKAIVKEILSASSSASLAKGDFRLLSYEWGVTYAGMLSAAEATGDSKFKDYTFDRLTFLNELFKHYNNSTLSEEKPSPIDKVLHPHALDDAGAMCAALIKAKQAGLNEDVRPMVNNFIDFIMNKQYRLQDGTLARNRPLKNTLWLDDLFMSVPALAQMGKLSGEMKYFDEATKQVELFSDRMFNAEKGIYMHGWVEGAENFPQFHWGRANGWAFMTLVELLDVLPQEHPKYDKMMGYFLAHAKGLAQYQSGTGFWHQLIDREDSYLETSATAIYTYCYAKAINNGWLDYRVFGPLTILGWTAVTTKVNDKGQVEGTCVGTGMGFDPGFYYYRPVNVYAAHGYGPVLLAGAEILKMLNKKTFKIDETAVQFSE
ncbi:glycoside hydrolase family 88/105 protein [Echinicola shivajiensis]|uniref:glycoside hydrolase family 88/105 protein n=1 Tax=Echinicola shivajiensis TaxID=1035916 RepID=UPI001BFCAFB1|nr:glycoside hydrolase family 88 protein [Echinicola shivajiensis]